MGVGTIVRGYLPLIIMTVVIFAALIGFGYGLLYRKLGKGRKRIGAGTWIWLVVFCSYLFIVGSVTLFARGNAYYGKVYPLFASYKEAWFEFSRQDWRNLILNIGMFIPFGFLLPVGIRWMQRFYKTTLCGFIVTLMIETIQFTAGLGIFEWDDVLNNTVGTMIGYGFFRIGYAVFNRKNQQKKVRIRTILVCQLPLLFTCLFYTLIFGSYAYQELGNLRSDEVTSFRKGSIQVSTDQQFDKAEKELFVYELQKLNEQECRQYAEQFLENLNDTLDEKQTISYDATDVFYSEKGNQFWLDKTGLTWDYTDFDETFHEESTDEDGSGKTEDMISPAANAKETDIRACLQKYQVTLPEEAVFSDCGKGRYTFKVTNLIIGEKIYDGELECTYYSDDKIGSIRNNIKNGVCYKKYPVISEQEAYERICAGRFYLWENNADTYQIHVDKVTSGYQQDSKGFYQPVYLFDVHMNGKKSVIEIPARK